MPPVSSSSRVPLRDTVLPLSRPLTLRKGQVVDRLVAPAGSFIILSIAVANMSPELFGDDAASFRPERWLDGHLATRDVPHSVYSPLLSFLGGPHGCLGASGGPHAC